jgi:predicted flap endonuclease-1-like 5' DNA nuclease
LEQKVIKVMPQNSWLEMPMRTDYLYYLLAVVFFSIAATSVALVADGTEKTLWAIGAVVLGLVSIGLGYYRKPKPKIAATSTSEVQLSEFGDAHIRESHLAESVEKHSEPFAASITTTSIPMQEPAPMPILTPGPTRPASPAPAEMPTITAETLPSESELLTIKGISEKRATQLNAVGIKTIADLAKASAEDLAKKLLISPKITRMWIGSAKELQKQSE